MTYTPNHKKRASGTYTYLVKPYRKDGAPRSDQIYIGEKSKADKILADLALKKLKNERFYSYSAECILTEIAKRLKLTSAIYNHVKKDTEVNCGKFMEYVIIERVLNPCSKWALANKIHKKSYFSLETEIDPCFFTEDNIYNYMDYTYPHIHDIQLNLIKNMQRNFKIKVDELILDGTSTYFFIEDPIEEADVDLVVDNGHSRDKRPDLKQINIMLGTNEEYIPLFFESFSGNTSDYEMFQDSLKLLRTKFRSLLKSVKKRYIVIDNGNISEGKFKTVELLDNFCKKHETYFVAGLKKSKVKKELINTEMDLTNAIYEYKKTKIYGKVIKKELYGKMRNVLLYYNPKVEKRQKKQFEKKLTKIRTKVAKINKEDETLVIKRERIKSVLRSNGALKLFKLVDSGYTVKCMINKEEKEERLALKGKFAIFGNNLDLDAKEMIRIYKTKSKVEHEFRLLKNLFSIRSFNHRKPRRIKTHVAIVMWGIMLTALLKHTLKQHKIECSFETLLETIKEGLLEKGIFEHPDLNKKLDITRVKYISEDIEQIFSHLKLKYDYLDIKEIAPTNRKK